jgi:hypothetical protein
VNDIAQMPVCGSIEQNNASRIGLVAASVLGVRMSRRFIIMRGAMTGQPSM